MTDIDVFQRDIQMALISSGQSEQAYKDFRSWMGTVSSMLDELEPVYGDPKIVEMELAKLKVGARVLIASKMFL